MRTESRCGNLCERRRTELPPRSAVRRRVHMCAGGSGSSGHGGGATEKVRTAVACRHCHSPSWRRNAQRCGAGGGASRVGHAARHPQHCGPACFVLGGHHPALPVHRECTSSPILIMLLGASHNWAAWTELCGCGGRPMDRHQASAAPIDSLLSQVPQQLEGAAQSGRAAASRSARPGRKGT